MHYTFGWGTLRGTPEVTSGDLSYHLAIYLPSLNTLLGLGTSLWPQCSQVLEAADLFCPLL